jgi:hypothetical protein
VFGARSSEANAWSSSKTRESSLPRVLKRGSCRFAFLSRVDGAKQHNPTFPSSNSG